MSVFGCARFEPPPATVESHAGGHEVEPSAAPSETTPDATPDASAGAKVEVEPGVQLETLRLPGGQEVWIYTPTPAVEVKDVVLIAPAGSNLITGMKLSEGDRPEHLPYVRAGFVVFAYELPGSVPADADDPTVAAALGEFRSDEAGLRTARLILDETEKRYPAQLARGVLVAGHSSAGTHALWVASQEPRIRAVAAFAPAIDVQAHLGEAAVAQLDRGFPGYADFLARISPINIVAALANKPVFLFSARDDQVVVGQAGRLATAIQKAGTDNPPKHVEVDSGGHYQSMIDDGIPAAIAWFGTLDDVVSR